MRKLVLFMIVSVFYTVSYSQQTSSVNGKITDKQTSEPLPRATVTIKGTSTSVITNSEGHYSITNIRSGQIILVISYVGYENIETATLVNEGATTVVDAALNLLANAGNEVVVAASKRPEKIINAPASIHVIGKKELEQFSGSNVFELFSKIQGIEVVRTGVDYIAINARGFNRTANNKVLQIIDGRNSTTTISTGLPVYNNASINKEDIESTEIILGPQAALYGPNVQNALLYVTTKDPRKYPGTTVAVSGGNQYQFSARLRQATKINNKWAYKLTGEYVTGKEFEFYDSVYAGNQTGATPSFGPAIAIPERNLNFDFRHIRGEAHVYYSLSPTTDIIISSGSSNNSFLGVSNTGRNQMKGINIAFLQARLVSRNLFLNIYNTWADISNSYSIVSYTRDVWNRTHTNPPMLPDSAELYSRRLGNMFSEKNQRLNAEAQYNYSFQKLGLFIVAGLSYQKEKPNSFGYSLVDKDERIFISQTGAVMQLEKLLPEDTRFIAAARFDNHSNLGNFFSPKFALTKQIRENNFRLTWARAYSMPSIFYQYANSNGVLFGNGAGIRYIPNGSTYNEASVTSTEGLEAEQTDTWEIGYKGKLFQKLYIDINYYNCLNRNFLSPPQPVNGRAIDVNGIPVVSAIPGVVINDTLEQASFNTFFNYGNVKAYGLDIGLNYSFSKFVNFSVRYSWFGSDITKDKLKNDANKDGFVSLEETSINAPKNKVVSILSFQNLSKQKIFVNVSARFTEQHAFYTGSHIGTEFGKGRRGKVYWGNEPLTNQPRYYIKNFDWGPLGGFTIFDVRAGLKLNNMTNLNMGVTNLFNSKQLEFVGSPPIGRLIMFELKVHLPNSNKEQK